MTTLERTIAFKTDTTQGLAPMSLHILQNGFRPQPIPGLEENLLSEVDCDTTVNISVTYSLLHIKANDKHALSRLNVPCTNQQHKLHNR